jgi:hypothetical protein
MASTTRRTAAKDYRSDCNGTNTIFGVCSFTSLVQQWTTLRSRWTAMAAKKFLHSVEDATTKTEDSRQVHVATATSTGMIFGLFYIIFDQLQRTAFLSRLAATWLREFLRVEGGKQRRQRRRATTTTDSDDSDDNDGQQAKADRNDCNGSLCYVLSHYSIKNQLH